MGTSNIECSFAICPVTTQSRGSNVINGTSLFCQFAVNVFRHFINEDDNIESDGKLRLLGCEFNCEDQINNGISF